MSEWIDVFDRTPESEQLKKYEVKTVEGSMATENRERILLGKTYPAGFRFMVGDWQRVTHWRELI